MDYIILKASMQPRKKLTEKKDNLWKERVFLNIAADKQLTPEFEASN